MGAVLSHLVRGGEKYPRFIKETASEGRRDEGKTLAGEGKKREVGKRIETAENFYHLPPSHWRLKSCDRVCRV